MIDERPAESRGSRRLGLRFSLIEACVVLLYLCVGIAAAKSGGLVAWLFAEATIVLFVVFVVAAIYLRGSARAFATGFVIGAGVHAGLLAYFGASEFDPHAARLPFSRIVAPLWDAMEPERFVAPWNDEELPRDQVSTIYEAYADGRMHPTYQAPDGSAVDRVELPPREDFMLAAHTLAGAAAGYAMGKLASVLWRRRRQPVASSGILANPEDSP